MRIRSIKPEFWRSDDVNQLSIEDRLLFIGLWSYVDDNGVGIDRFSDICADLFAHDLSVSPHDTLMRVQEGLYRLAQLGVIRRYRVAGKRYLEVVNWKKHQKINRPSPGRYPQYDAENATIHASITEHSLSAHEDSLPGTGEQRNRGTGEQGNSLSSSSAVAERGPDLDALFEAAYSEWPKKVERKKSLEKFKQACKRRDADELVADIRKFGQAYAATTDTQFVPALNVWLNGERWTDDLPQPRNTGSGHARAVQRQTANLSVVDHFRYLEEQEQKGLTA